MLQHRGLLAVLALIAVIGFAAGDCRAETITLTVSWSGHTFTASGTSGTYVGPGSGPAGAQTVLNINVGALNSDLSGFGSAYQFAELGAQSNFPGTTGTAGGFILTSGTLVVQTSGTAGTIIVTATEGGFTAPSGGPGTMLATGQTANYTGTTAGSSQMGTGSFSDSSSPAVTASVGPVSLPSNGTLTDDHSDGASKLLPPYVTPYTLTASLTFSLTPRGTSSGGDGFSAQTSVTSVPEPATMVMFLTGMPVPFVLVGLMGLRRRRASAG